MHGRYSFVAGGLPKGNPPGWVTAQMGHDVQLFEFVRVARCSVIEK
jgi:hypothetical protein